MTKRSNLSHYGICDTSIIQSFSHSPNVSYKRVRTVLGFCPFQGDPAEGTQTDFVSLINPY